MKLSHVLPEWWVQGGARQLCSLWQNLKPTQVLIGRKKDNYTVVYSHCGVLYSSENERVAIPGRTGWILVTVYGRISQLWH